MEWAANWLKGLAGGGAPSSSTTEGSTPGGKAGKPALLRKMSKKPWRDEQKAKKAAEAGVPTQPAADGPARIDASEFFAAPAPAIAPLALPMITESNREKSSADGSGARARGATCTGNALFSSLEGTRSEACGGLRRSRGLLADRAAAAAALTCDAAHALFSWPKDAW